MLEAKKACPHCLFDKRISCQCPFKVKIGLINVNGFENSHSIIITVFLRFKGYMKMKMNVSAMFLPIRKLV
jgi:hypothetical protein